MTLQQIIDTITANADTVTSGKKGLKAYINVVEVAEAIYKKLQEKK